VWPLELMFAAPLLVPGLSDPTTSHAVMTTTFLSPGLVGPSAGGHVRAHDELLAFPLTPFTDDLGLNLDAFADHLEGHVSAGAAALFVACGTGEFGALSPQEPALLLRRAREVVGGRIPVWLGAGGGAAMARAGVGAAAGGGADGVLPPYLATGATDGLADHVRYAAGETGIPLIVYHRSPGSTPRGRPPRCWTSRRSPDSRTVSATWTDEPDRRGRPRGFAAGLPQRTADGAGVGTGRRRAWGVTVLLCGALFRAGDRGPVPPGTGRRGRRADRHAAHRLLPAPGGPAGRDTGIRGVAGQGGGPGAGQKVGGVRLPLTEPRPDQLARLEAIIDRGLQVLAELG
jgi:5-dehydro-4-deoxyglucarate dehydratase